MRMNDEHKSQTIVYTIGHSNHSAVDFMAILRAHGVACIADVRSAPGSRHNPQFNQAELAETLNRAGIKYIHMPGLGGRRRSCGDSVNLGWENLSFRGYADYMRTPEFEKNLDALISLASKERTAIMCAEAVPWRCHRSLISDALAARGLAVKHIMNANASRPHTVTSFAEVKGGRVTYPAVTLELIPAEKSRHYEEETESSG